MELNTTKRWGMVIDANRCVGCYACWIACFDEHVGVDHMPIAAPQPESGHRWMNIKVHEQGKYPRLNVKYAPLPCLMCEDAPCMKVDANGAVTRRPDGIVLIDPVKAKGQKQLVRSCPYGVIYWNEELDTAQKCTFCAHLLDDGWKLPRCVEACPTQALVFGDLNDSSSVAASRFNEPEIEELRPEWENKTLARYIGLPKRYIAGEIVFSDKLEEPADGVTLTLRRGTEVLTAATDSHGEFEFRQALSGDPYTLYVSHPGYVPREIEVPTRHDLDLGEVKLNRV